MLIRFSHSITDVSAMLDKIHYFRVHDYVEQLAVIQVLEDRLAENKRIKLIGSVH
eukprot:m.104336 g.104336  ORF g.104336 m.104336 type:complete len:55 (+) comp16843_c0_seq22:52-216(+)